MSRATSSTRDSSLPRLQCSSHAETSGRWSMRGSVGWLWCCQIWWKMEGYRMQPYWLKYNSYYTHAWISNRGYFHVIPMMQCSTRAHDCINLITCCHNGCKTWSLSSLQEVCHQYWPTGDTKRVQKYGEFNVSVLQATQQDGFIQRMLSVTNPKVRDRQVSLQFYYRSTWALSTVDSGCLAHAPISLDCKKLCT